MGTDKNIKLHIVTDIKVNYYREKCGEDFDITSEKCRWGFVTCHLK